MKNTTYLIIGLGNPGEEYNNTFHNAGWMLALQWIKLSGFPAPKEEKKLLSLVSEKRIKGSRAVIALPETFMNKSGKAAEMLVKKYKVKSDHVVVLHDDSDVLLGKIKIVKNRGSAGHKGVESVMRALKTEDFARIRIGTTKVISKKGIWRERDLMDVVVKKIPSSQQALLKKALKQGTEALDLITHGEFEKAMSIYNA